MGTRLCRLVGGFLTIGLGVALSGCATQPFSCERVLSACPYRSVGVTHSAESQPYLDVSLEAAVLAANSYSEKEYSLAVPSGIEQVAEYSTWAGLDAFAFVDHREVSEYGLLLVFRGTEGVNPLSPESWRDWLFGNILTVQHSQAEGFARAIVDKYADGRATVATGHSLGGGIALHVSQALDSVDSIVFNPSTKIPSRDPRQARRILIAQDKEILDRLRSVFSAPSGTIELSDLDCTMANRHGMYLLARCILHSIASAERKEFETYARALSILKASPTPRCADGWVHVGQDGEAADVSVGEQLSIEESTYMRHGVPSFPFYRMPPVAYRILDGARLEVLDITRGVGISQQTWARLSAPQCDWHE